MKTTHHHLPVGVGVGQAGVKRDEVQLKEGRKTRKVVLIFLPFGGLEITQVNFEMTSVHLRINNSQTVIICVMKMMMKMNSSYRLLLLSTR